MDIDTAANLILAAIIFAEIIIGAAAVTLMGKDKNDEGSD